MPSPVARLGKPQQALEKKFVFNAAASAPREHTAVLQPIVRKNSPAHNPSTSSETGTEKFT